ncbi:CaiB/BaiF CoA-transferase family protein, partial [Haladaptatus sp. W1]
GLMSITGEADGSPVRVGVAIADIGAGMYATQAILAALLERELGDGTGQKVDVSLLDGQVAWMSYMASNYFATGTPPERMGSKHPTLAPYQAYPTADGYVVIAVPSPNLWPKFCRAIDREDLIDDERFRDNASRVENRDELDALLEPTFAEFTTAEIVETMDDHGVPATDVKDMQDVFDNPQVNARNMQWSVSHPTAGDVEMAGSPMHLSKTPTRVRAHPPLLGEHTEAILSEFGYTEADIERLSDEGVL